MIVSLDGPSKKVNYIFATFLLLEIISGFQLMIFLESFCVSEKSGLTVSQTFLLSRMSLGSRFP